MSGRNKVLQHDMYRNSVSYILGFQTMQTQEWPKRNHLIFEKYLQLVDLRRFRHHSNQIATGDAAQCAGRGYDHRNF